MTELETDQRIDIIEAELTALYARLEAHGIGPCAAGTALMFHGAGLVAGASSPAHALAACLALTESIRESARRQH